MNEHRFLTKLGLPTLISVRPATRIPAGCGIHPEVKIAKTIMTCKTSPLSRQGYSQFSSGIGTDEGTVKLVHDIVFFLPTLTPETQGVKYIQRKQQ